MRPVTVTIIILLLIFSFFFIKPMLVSVEKTGPPEFPNVEKTELPELPKDVQEQEKNLTEQPEKPSCSDECQTETCQGLKYYKCVVQDDGCKHKVDNGTVKSKCGIECFFNSDCKQDQECSSYKCRTKNPELDLKEFPDPFLKEALIVVGATASPVDVISVVEVSTMLQKKTGTEVPKKLDQEVVGQEAEYNFILIGSPCDNKFVEKIFGMTCEGWTLEEGKALIKITANGDKTAMLIAGKTPQDTLRAAKMVAAYESNNLEGTEMIV